MLHTTRAIVLRTVRHGDNAVVLKAWTRHAGARSYLARLSRRQGTTMALLQPLNRIELVAEERADRELNTVRELRVEEPYARLHADPVRAAIALFTQELLGRALRAESADEELDDFVREALRVIDQEPDLRWFPTVFVLQLARRFGFFPEPPLPGQDHFDLQEGCFVAGAARHDHLLAPPLSTAFAELLHADLNCLQEVGTASSLRRQLLDHALLYLRLHLDGIGELRSPEVLHAALS